MSNSKDDLKVKEVDLKSQLEEQLESELNSRSKRLQRTLGIWEKLQDKMEQILTDKKAPSSSMLTAISKTLTDQLKLAGQSE